LGVVVASKQHVLGQSSRDEASLHFILSFNGNSHEITTEQKTDIVLPFTFSYNHMVKI
jgi:hypothetical protein